MDVSISVGGVWQTRVDVPEDATWDYVQEMICQETGIPAYMQRLNLAPDRRVDLVAHFDEGTELVLEWQLRSGQHPLHTAAEMGNTAAIRSWVTSGADVNVTDEHGGTPLMEAAASCWPETVAELLRLGADARLTNTMGYTALHHLAATPRFGEQVASAVAVVRLLVAAGCDPHARTAPPRLLPWPPGGRAEGRTALDMAEEPPPNWVPLPTDEVVLDALRAVTRPVMDAEERDNRPAP